MYIYFNLILPLFHIVFSDFFFLSRRWRIISPEVVYLSFCYSATWKRVYKIRTACLLTYGPLRCYFFIESWNCLSFLEAFNCVVPKWLVFKMRQFFFSFFDLNYTFSAQWTSVLEVYFQKGHSSAHSLSGWVGFPAQDNWFVLAEPHDINVSPSSKSDYDVRQHCPWYHPRGTLLLNRKQLDYNWLPPLLEPNSSCQFSV